MKTATSTSATTNFSITPLGGSYYATTTQYMDLAIASWETDGNRNKIWTASSTSADEYLTLATTTVYTIGDLLPNTPYQFKIDSTATTTAITGTNCTDGLCTSNGSGQIIFTYSGGYSSHTFALDRVISQSTQPTSLLYTPNISKVNTENITNNSALITFTTDKEGNSQVLYSDENYYNRFNLFSDIEIDNNLTTSHSIKLTNLKPNTTYYFSIKSKGPVNTGIGIDTYSFTTKTLEENIDEVQTTEETITTTTTTTTETQTTPLETTTVSDSLSLTEQVFTKIFTSV
jgi:hypothetical protein